MIALIRMETSLRRTKCCGQNWGSARIFSLHLRNRSSFSRPERVVAPVCAINPSRPSTRAGPAALMSEFIKATRASNGLAGVHV